MRSELRIGVLALLAGCQTTHMGQFGEEEEIRCEPTSRTPVLPEDTVEIGFVDPAAPEHLDGPQSVVVGDVLAIAAGTFIETLEWSDASETPITALLEDAGAPEVVTYEDAGSAEDTETVAGLCPTLLEFTVGMTLTTDDGRLNDTFVGTASSAGEGVYVAHDITAPGGTIDVQALAAEGVDVEPDVVRVHFRLPQWSGGLRPQPIGGIDDDARAVGTWPAGAFED